MSDSKKNAEFRVQVGNLYIYMYYKGENPWRKQTLLMDK